MFTIPPSSHVLPLPLNLFSDFLPTFLLFIYFCVPRARYCQQVIYWIMRKMNGYNTEESIPPPLTANNCQWLLEEAWSLMVPNEMLTGAILYGFLCRNHSSLVFMSNMAMLYPENSISQHVPILWPHVWYWACDCHLFRALWPHRGLHQPLPGAKRNFPDQGWEEHWLTLTNIII